MSLITQTTNRTGLNILKDQVELFYMQFDKNVCSLYHFLRTEKVGKSRLFLQWDMNFGLKKWGLVCPEPTYDSLLRKEVQNTGGGGF